MPKGQPLGACGIARTAQAERQNLNPLMYSPQEL
jgi:hypothetical protein